MQPLLSKYEIMLRKPKPGDESTIHNLIKQSPPLDLNSIYSYHLLCRHFSETSIVAVDHNNIVGFISAYIKPNQSDTLFVWQVVVAPSQRGKGLARLMLQSILAGSACDEVKIVESTVNPSNVASRKLFEGIARKHKCSVKESLFMNKESFGNHSHEEEILLTIGPLK